MVRDREGKAVAEGQATFDLSSLHPDWGEQSVEDWWTSTRTAIRRVSGMSVRFEPGDGRSARYDKLYEVYGRIYPSLRPIFPKLADAWK